MLPHPIVLAATPPVASHEDYMPSLLAFPFMNCYIFCPSPPFLDPVHDVPSFPLLYYAILSVQKSPSNLPRPSTSSEV